MASTIKVNTLTTQSGSTLTVGESGKTISLASGATATGFGRTGAVDWQTTKKTSDFTAATTEGYFVDTSSGAVTATLPSSPSAGAIVGFKDYTATFGTNNLNYSHKIKDINKIIDIYKIILSDIKIKINSNKKLIKYKEIKNLFQVRK